ncbi:redoxin domain-containing protein [bacterium]|nr:redoxin domain-containing protein [bacterium]
MKSLLWLRLFKLAVLVGVPVLAGVYSYQFTLVQSDEEVPFQSFRAPETSLFNAQVKAISQLELREPITIVNFWATWCPPCVSEFPSMIELQRQLEGKGVELIFVSVDDSWEKVLKFQDENVIDVRADRQFWDPSKEASLAWGSTRFPETYVVRKDGWVVEKIVGEQRWTRPVVVKYFLDLAQDVSEELSNFTDLVFPSAYAQRIHEDDKKTLDQLKKNIEVATENFLNSQAALRNEQRNFSQLKVKVEKQKEELERSKEQESQLSLKKAEIEKAQLKNKTASNTEANERKTVAEAIKESQKKITELERQLETEKVKLVERQKLLSTRNQNLESLNKAKDALDEDIEKIDGRLEASKKLVREKESELKGARRELRNREGAVSDLERKVKKHENSVDEQKKKLVEFEKILKK